MKRKRRSQGPLKPSALMEQVEREKIAAREADEADFASGRRSAEEIDRANNPFHGHRFEVDLKSAKRLW